VRCYDETDDDEITTLLLYENNPMGYLLIVDGPTGGGSNFTLAATCP